MDIEDSERKIFENMGRCLSTWNKIEENILTLLEYLHSHDGVVVPAELGLGYWSIISFEARLKWAANILEYRLNPKIPEYKDLRNDWSKIRESLKKLSSKRAEVAHGTVVWLPEEKTGLRALLVPALQKKLTSHRMLLGADVTKPLVTVLGGLDANELLAREQLFHKEAEKIYVFRTRVREVDTSLGRFQ